MKIDYYLVYPGGNTTVLVKTEVSRDQQPNIARQLLESTQLRNERVEQIGFIEKPILTSHLGRLQMGGGELCINASRSLVAILASETSREVVDLEISGYDSEDGLPETVATTARKGSGEHVYEVVLPLKIEALTGGSPWSSQEVQLQGESLGVKIVDLKGITHLVAEKNLLPSGLRALLTSENSGKSEKEMPELASFFNELYEQIPQLKNVPAVGFMALDSLAESKYKLEPLVKVNDQSSIFYETSCGSGTVACALVKTQETSGGNLSFLQPSGDNLTTKQFMNPNNEQIIELQGEVRILKSDGVIVL